MFEKFLGNCKRPNGIYGTIIANMMNKGYAPLSKWAFEVCPLKNGEKVLDVGCGGGGNMVRIMKQCSESQVYGIDYSQTSVECSRKNTEKFSDRCSVSYGDAMFLPYDDNTFDRVVSFESIYFWTDPMKGIQEIMRVLKKGGKIVLASEMTNPEKGKFWTDHCEGMTIYNSQQLAEFLKQAGFVGVKTHTAHKVWCVVEGDKKC